MECLTSKRIKIDGREVEGERCMSEGEGKLCFSEKDRGSVEGLYGKDQE